MELHAAMSQQLKDAIRWLEEKERVLDAKLDDDSFLAAVHARTILAAIESLQAEVEALKR